MNFANTVGNHRETTANDALATYEDVAAWCRRAGAISQAQYVQALREAQRAPRAASDAVVLAHELRRLIYALASANAKHVAARRADLHGFNELLLAAAARPVLRQAPDRYRQEWLDDPRDVRSVLWPIARNAADLLASPNAELIVECEGDDCTWLFIDRTKNHSKRFCRPDGCGNRARARRFYAQRLR